MLHSSIDGANFRNVLGHYPTGAAVITCSANGRPAGMVVGSFTSVSLDPPLVGFLPNLTSHTWPAIAKAGAFCVNILASDQMELCRAFSGPRDKRFESQDYRLSPNRSPILDGVVAWIDCSLHAAHPAGDHMIVIGLVGALAIERTVEPMVFVGSRYRTFEPLRVERGAAGGANAA